MESSDKGIVLLDKNEGETSFDVVKGVRRILKIKKVGHAGTLDPFATGLLLILLGQGTKLSSNLMEHEKTYRATMRLGIETDSQDPTGLIVHSRPVPDFKEEYIKEKAKGFIGVIEQIPPAFSAVNYKGKRAYEFARKGIRVQLEKREVTIHSIGIVSIDLPEVTMEISCSGGTYIRTLAADLGKRLGTGAHLRALRRLSCGPFKVADALDSKHVRSASSRFLLHNRIIPIREALPHMKETQIDGPMAKKIRNGYQPHWDEGLAGSHLPDFYEGHMKLVHGTDLVAIMKVCRLSGNANKQLKIMRVFN